MKRSGSDPISLNFGTPDISPRTSSDFEEVSYPHIATTQHSHNAWPAAPPHYEEELPLHYMSEETARRRVHRAPAAGNGVYPSHIEGADEYDDEGKDVYAKMRASKMPMSSGRPRRPPPPPATTIVRTPQSSLLWPHS